MESWQVRNILRCSFGNCECRELASGVVAIRIAPGKLLVGYMRFDYIPRNGVCADTDHPGIHVLIVDGRHWTDALILAKDSLQRQDTKAPNWRKRARPFKRRINAMNGLTIMHKMKAAISDLVKSSQVPTSSGRVESWMEFAPGVVGGQTEIGGVLCFDSRVYDSDFKNPEEDPNIRYAAGNRILYVKLGSITWERMRITAEQHLRRKIDRRVNWHLLSRPL